MINSFNINSSSWESAINDSWLVNPLVNCFEQIIPRSCYFAAGFISRGVDSQVLQLTCSWKSKWVGEPDQGGDDCKSRRGRRTIAWIDCSAYWAISREQLTDQPSICFHPFIKPRQSYHAFKQCITCTMHFMFIIFLLWNQVSDKRCPHIKSQKVLQMHFSLLDY